MIPEPHNLYPIKEVHVSSDYIEVELQGGQCVKFPAGVRMERREGVMMLAFIVGGGEGEVQMQTQKLDEPIFPDMVTSNARTLVTLTFPTSVPLVEVRA